MSNNNNYLKELRLWLCASLKNSDAQLICDCNLNNNNDVINELEEIKNALLELIERVNNIQNALININSNKGDNDDDKQRNEH